MTDSPGEVVRGPVPLKKGLANKEALSPSMAEPQVRNVRKGLFEPLTAAAVVFFLMAVVFAAAPAMNAGPTTIAGLLLLIGLAGVACLGLFVLRGSTDAPSDSQPGAELLVDALSEPAAIASNSGLRNPSAKNAIVPIPVSMKDCVARFSISLVFVCFHLSNSESPLITIKAIAIGM